MLMSECHVETMMRPGELDDLTSDDTFQEENHTNNQMPRDLCLLLRDWRRKLAEKLLKTGVGDAGRPAFCQEGHEGGGFSKRGICSINFSRS